MTYPILDRIHSHADVIALPENDTEPLCRDIRRFLIDTVPQTGGHLASNLGLVELTVALHRLCDPEKDHILFDTGHQCYVHKILSGRKEEFFTLRTPGGLSGFPSRKESPADSFGAGHSGTSVSAAIGFAEADRQAGRDAYTFAIVGDGAYTNGIIHEAMNNTGKTQRLIVILNENEMSISPTIGSFASYLAKIRASRSYVNAKRKTARILLRIPVLGKPLHRSLVKIKQRIKNKLYNSNYFESLGFFYIGPIDGNDYKTVLSALTEALHQGENVFLHIRTKKGKGYLPAEKDPALYHSLPPGGEKKPDKTYHGVFGETLTELAEKDSRIVAVTAAMTSGTGLSAFGEAFPERLYDVGIAEEHALAFAAGLAANGMIPFFAVYSPFLQRGYDNIANDIALQNLPVKIAVDRAGLALHDGPTHHGIYDVAFLSSIPGIELYTPASFRSMKEMLRDMVSSDCPSVIRYPNAGEDARVNELFYPDGNYAVRGIRAYHTENRPDAVIVTYGQTVSLVLDACAKTGRQDIGIILLEKPMPYDNCAKEIMNRITAKTPLLFVEEGMYAGSAGMNLSCRMAENGYRGVYKILAFQNAAPKPITPDDIVSEVLKLVN